MGKGALQDLQAVPEPNMVSKDVADAGSSDQSVAEDAVLSIDGTRTVVNEDTTMRRSASW